MNVLSRTRQLEVLALVCAGHSLRSIVQGTGVNINTIDSLILKVGNACQRFLDERLQRIRSQRVNLIQCDTYMRKATWPVAIVLAVDDNNGLVIHHRLWLTPAGDDNYFPFFNNVQERLLANRWQLNSDALGIHWAPGTTRNGTDHWVDADPAHQVKPPEGLMGPWSKNKQQIPRSMDHLNAIMSLHVTHYNFVGEDAPALRANSFLRSMTLDDILELAQVKAYG